MLWALGWTSITIHYNFVSIFNHFNFLAWCYLDISVVVNSNSKLKWEQFVIAGFWGKPFFSLSWAEADLDKYPCHFSKTDEVFGTPLY